MPIGLRWAGPGRSRRTGGPPWRKSVRCLGAGSRERLVLDPVRLQRGGGAGLLYPRGVLLPAPLEPRRLRVAFERQDVRGDAVEEPAVVRDHDGAAGEVE